MKYFKEEQKLNETPNRPSFSKQTSIASLEDSISFRSQTSPPILSNQNSLNSTKSPTLSLTNQADSAAAAALKASASQVNDSILQECNKLIEHFNNAYLKALFDYLVNKDRAIMKTLFDRDILFQDRVALSVHFMFDPNNLNQLQDYFDKLIEDECLKYSDLNGVLLTGLGPKCIDLFQSFIDKTGDIQSISLAIIHTPYIDVLESNQVEYWLNCYKEQLNKFKFWEKRAEFDILRMKLKKFQNLVTSPEQVCSEIFFIIKISK